MSAAITKQLAIKDLHVSINQKQILHGINLTLPQGKVIALMGPNGSGKSTLAQVLMGHPSYEVHKGKAMWGQKNILDLEVHERAQMGLFLSFQYPQELPGVNMYEFLSTAYIALHGQKKFEKYFENAIAQALKQFRLSNQFLERNVNEGFSGGEKKKSEMLQLQLLQPTVAILDETDSGLDIDALKLIAKNVQALRSSRNTFLIITHYQRLLTLLKPDEVHVMMHGRIVKSGSYDLVKTLEKKGYGWLEK